MFIVQAMTGHKTLSQLERYVNVKASDVVKVMHASPPVPAADAPATVSPDANESSAAPPNGPGEESGPLHFVGNLLRPNFGRRRVR